MRIASASDLQALYELEQSSFEPYRQESKDTILRSIQSPAQEVWVTGNKSCLTGSMILRPYRKSLRIYSLAVRQEARGTGLGAKLMHKAFLRGRELGVVKINLEVDDQADRLVAWYQSFGFTTRAVLKDYYGCGKSALKMTAPISSSKTKK